MSIGAYCPYRRYAAMYQDSQKRRTHPLVPFLSIELLSMLALSLSNQIRLPNSNFLLRAFSQVIIFSLFTLIPP